MRDDEVCGTCGSWLRVTKPLALVMERQEAPVLDHWGSCLDVGMATELFSTEPVRTHRRFGCRHWKPTGTEAVRRMRERGDGP